MPAIRVGASGLILVVLVLSMFVGGEAAAVGMPNHVRGIANPQSYDVGKYMYGIHGQMYCSTNWPAYYNRLNWNEQVHEKNVSAFYVRADTPNGARFVEIGFDNDWITWDEGGRQDSAPSRIFYAWENQPYVGYRYRPSPYSPDVVRGQPGTWVQFEINNHAMDSANGVWYAAWNGNTVMHGLTMQGFTQGFPMVVAERLGTRVKNWGPWVSADASFRYLHYKRNAQHQWAAWNGATIWDYDDHWRLAPVSGYTNRFYVYQDVNY